MIKESKLTSERIKEYLAEGKRFDGRKLDEFRDISIELGISKKAEGSAKVKIGDTEVWVGVKAGVTTPYPDSLDKGSMMVSAETTPLSNSKYEYGPPRFPAIELGRLVDRGIRESKIIDFGKLCIEKGVKVWNIFIDVYTINDDGNILDAAFLGALAALKSAKLPVYDKENDIIDYEADSKEMIPLTDNLPLNYNVYKTGDKIFLDPTIEEEVASDGKLTVGIIDDSPLRICSMQKSDLITLTPKEFGEMLDLIEKTHKTFSKDILDKIDKAIKANK